MGIAKANRWAAALLLVALFVLPACAPAFAQGRLFECRLPARAPNYLLGTMHSADPQVLAVADTLRDPLRHARRLVLELVPDGPARLAAAQAGVLPHGQRLRDLVDAELHAAVVAAMSERGVVPEMVERMQPWALAMELSLPAGPRGGFLDLHLHEIAVAAGLEIVGLESVAEQLRVFDALAAAEQVELLRYAVKNLPRVPQQYRAMVDAYVAGDLAGLRTLADAQQQDLGRRLVDWFAGAMVGERNVRMAERLRHIWTEGGAVVAVGALHLTGETGLLAALRRDGCDWRVLH